MAENKMNVTVLNEDPGKYMGNQKCKCFKQCNKDEFGSLRIIKFKKLKIQHGSSLQNI